MGGGPKILIITPLSGVKDFFGNLLAVNIWGSAWGGLGVGFGEGFARPPGSHVAEAEVAS